MTDGCVYALSGELDAARAPRVRSGIWERAVRCTGDVTIDCRGLAFLDSSGLQVLFEVYRRLQQQGRSLFLTNLAGPPRRALSLTGMDAYLRTG